MKFNFEKLQAAEVAASQQHGRMSNGLKKYRYLSKDLLIQNNYRVEFEEDGTPKVMSYKRNKQGQEIAIFTIGGRHKHKTSQEPYLFVGLMLNGTLSGTYSLARVVWAWCKGECPEDMTVDHIDNKHSTAYDNRIDNLQLLSLSDNLKKRGYSRNQYTYHLSDEQIEKRKKIAVELKKIKEQKFWTNENIDISINRILELENRKRDLETDSNNETSKIKSKYDEYIAAVDAELVSREEELGTQRQIYKDLVNREKELIKARRCK